MGYSQLHEGGVGRKEVAVAFQKKRRQFRVFPHLPMSTMFTFLCCELSSSSTVLVEAMVAFFAPPPKKGSFMAERNKERKSNTQRTAAPAPPPQAFCSPPPLWGSLSPFLQPHRDDKPCARRLASKISRQISDVSMCRYVDVTQHCRTLARRAKDLIG